MNQLFAKFDARIRPVTSRIRRMILARAMKLKPEPSEEQYQKEMTELTNMILPMIDDLLTGKLYFCGSEITGFDLQVFCEINSLIAIAEDKQLEEKVSEFRNIEAWRENIKIIPEVQDMETKFTISVNKILLQ